MAEFREYRDGAGEEIWAMKLTEPVNVKHDWGWEQGFKGDYLARHCQTFCIYSTWFIEHQCEPVEEAGR